MTARSVERRQGMRNAGKRVTGRAPTPPPPGEQVAGAGSRLAGWQAGKWECWERYGPRATGLGAPGSPGRTAATGVAQQTKANGRAVGSQAARAAGMGGPQGHEAMKP